MLSLSPPGRGTKILQGSQDYLENLHMAIENAKLLLPNQTQNISRFIARIRNVVGRTEHLRKATECRTAVADAAGMWRGEVHEGPTLTNIRTHIISSGIQMQ